MLDLKSGFHQVGVAEEDRPKTAFCIPGSGIRQFKVMPFGAIISPAVFERLMKKSLIVYGKTFGVHMKPLKTFYNV